MKKSYKTVFGRGENELIINKSRFIGCVMPVDNEDQALSFIQSIKEKHKSATHNVFAYVLGEENQIQRFNDDGEPSGTAGIPVLDVIKKEDLRNVAIVVTRYFGGIKLGGGGLVRAYSRSAKLAIDSGIIVDMYVFKSIWAGVNYNVFGKLENYLRDKRIIPDEIIYEENVSVKLHIQNDLYEHFYLDLMEMTNGASEIAVEGEIYLPVKEGVRLLPGRGI